MAIDIFNKPLLVVVGPTAIGKTDLSLRIARRYNCEIVSVDSMQVYRYMDIGTAKASLEERSEIPHHLIDIIDPDQDYDAARFAEDALHAIGEIHGRGRLPLLTGGTGLYLRALLQGIFPGVPVDEIIRAKLRHRLHIVGCSKLHEELSAIDCISAERIHENDTHRLLRALEVYYASGVPWSEHLKEHRILTPGALFANTLEIGLTCDRRDLYERINRRCETMLDDGLEGEVRKLLEMGYHRELKSFGSIGYRHMLGYIHEEYSRQEMAELLARDTRRYAKRQYTWFRTMPGLHWYEVQAKEEIVEAVGDWLIKQNRRK
ncbi:MAG: tRNA delta(2)-isopentenylpyrophosphate transferase [Desulfobulbaceae bacterium BRH_c16a]|nr:MAG: tRNA delta(2)-isopentenylpyrophosphate transferase [Desulfobulbaceae bacterium BRH_c16a]